MGSLVSGSRSTIAVRMVGIKFLNELIDVCGPIVSTSANISLSGIKPATFEDIDKSILKKTDIVVQYTGTLPGIESTIVDITCKKPILLRKGAVEFI